MRAFITIIALPAAVLATIPIIHAGAPQDPPTIPGTLYPTNTTGISSTPTGNLSISITTPTLTSSSQNVVLITTSQAGGGLVTLTSLVGSTPTSATTSSGIGQTQPGAAAKFGNGAFGALALAVGVGAFLM